jgi:hypothetical protein
MKEGAKPSYHNARALLQKIDSLPHSPKWDCEIFEVDSGYCDDEGNPIKEEVELWKRNVVDVIGELLGNPAFRDGMQFAPMKVFSDEEGDCQEYDEMCTGEWWWEVQVSVNSPRRC